MRRGLSLFSRALKCGEYVSKRSSGVSEDASVGASPLFWAPSSSSIKNDFIASSS